VNPFWLAWSFLTVFPAPGQKTASAEDFVRSRIWYPAVGVALGAVWAAVAYALVRWNCPTGLVGVVLLAVPLLCTGFLHFDGLLDSADALLAPRSPERRMEILKDVHAGSFAIGVAGLWLLATSQILALGPSWPFLLALPILSRAALLGAIYLFPYARTADPTSLSDVSAALSWRWILPALFAAPAIWFFPLEALSVLVVQYLGGRWAAGKLGGGITGDIYGALLCLSETAALAVHVIEEMTC
jgi:adenosylcobinamide-GDP ribazoletransferase